MKFYKGCRAERPQVSFRRTVDRRSALKWHLTHSCSLPGISAALPPEVTPIQCVAMATASTSAQQCAKGGLIYFRFSTNRLNVDFIFVHTTMACVLPSEPADRNAPAVHTPAVHASPASKTFSKTAATPWNGSVTPGSAGRSPGAPSRTAGPPSHLAGTGTTAVRGSGVV